jgi:glycosyltransferase involved in cell wall biosynthesis
MAIHQIMPSFLYGDALGNQAVQIRSLLRGWGYESQVYAQFRDRRLKDPGEDYQRYCGGPDEIVIFHYSIGSPVTEFVRQVRGLVVPYYHNVTPSGFLRGYNEPLAALLEQGRRELILFKDAALALAASDYNRQEMLKLGFGWVEMLPYYLHLDDLRASASSPAGENIVAQYGNDVVNLLFVGRLVPNKRQDDLIRAFNAYHRLINPDSRLLLVGSGANAPGYRLELESMTAALDLTDCVHLPGGVGLREGLGGYYRAADLFLCLSEHEGFCIPLLEAMAFDLPVVAYRSTGVPYAMGQAGVLVDVKRFDVIAELIDLVLGNGARRSRLLAGQRRRLETFAAKRLDDVLRSCVDKIAALA